RLALGGFERGTKFLAAMHQAHAFATASSRGFQHHRVTNTFGNFFAFFGRSESARGSGNEGHSGLFHVLARAGFRTHHSHGMRSGPDKFHARIGARLGELSVLREKAV